MSLRRLGLLGVGAFVLVVMVLGQVLVALTPEGDVLSTFAWWDVFVPAVGMTGGGLAVLWRHPGHGVGRVLTVFGAWWGVDSLFGSYAGFSLHLDPSGDLPGAAFGWWLTTRVGAGLQLAMPLLVLVYPDGRWPRGRWRFPALVCVGASAFLLVVGLFAPYARMAPHHPSRSAVLERDYLTWDLFGDALPTVRLIGLGILGPALLIGVVRLVVLARSADPLTRTRARWLVWAALVDVLGVTVLGTLQLTGLAGDLAFLGGLAISGVCAAIGLLRPDLLDIARLLSGTVVYGVVVVGLLVVDAVVVAAVVALGGGRIADRDGAVLAVLLVAACYGPLREWLFRLVRRLVLGERVEPYRVLADLAGALEAGPDVGRRVQAVADAGIRAFRLRHVVVEVADLHPTVRGVAGSDPGIPLREVPLRYRGTRVGSLAFAGEVSSRDEQLLIDLARQAAVVLRTEDLAAELARRRARLVRAREDGRRRLRRDLHDELAPSLAGAAARLDHAVNLVPTDPGAARSVLDAAREDLQTAVVDVRRLANGLRPPALDDVGLTAAVERLAARLSVGRLRIAVRSDLPEVLPAAVEAALLAIVAEALANVVRHSGAQTCRVVLGAVSGTVTLEVHDDGGGSTEPAGAGLRGMVERAAELGGRCTWESSRTGWTVRAELPLATTVLAQEEVARV